MYRQLAILFLLAGLALAARPVSDPPISEERLGELLFFDPILSLDSSISCASCHRPEFAFADTLAFSVGVYGQLGTRNTPGVTNMSARDAFFWDGRSATLEAQALEPIKNPVEMGLEIEQAIHRLKQHSQYVQWFDEVYDRLPDEAALAAALAAFQRTLETSNTVWDRYNLDLISDDDIDPAIVRGKVVFDTKGKCIQCHFTPDFTGDEFRNVGTFDGVTLTDKGRFDVTGDSLDLGRFKVPGLRNVGVTAPYMHNGMFQTLREVIDFYDNPFAFVANPINLDTLMIEPLHLSEQEKQDLEAFLHSLTDARFLVQ
jgi:cytochrome c peroxidase